MIDLLVKEMKAGLLYESHIIWCWKILSGAEGKIE